MPCRCVDGEPVTIQHEPSNTRDRNALIVLGAQGQVPLLSSNRIPAILKSATHAVIDAAA